MLPSEASELIKSLTPLAIQKANELTRTTFRTRGGRIGSGMGLLLEALWGYFINVELDHIDADVEIGWIATHEYNDFACLEKDVDWSAATRAGEILRVELKSMVASAAESKAHFDKIHSELGEQDLLVVLLWDWARLDERRFYPSIRDCFVGRAIEVAALRDELHTVRGGSFVEAGNCPDQCEPTECTHVGEPLNAKGKRERLSGPAASKPTGVAYAANFGGLVRMLKTSGHEATQLFRRLRSSFDSAHEYINFIHRNLPIEEANQFSKSEWKGLAKDLDISLPQGAGKIEIRNAVAEDSATYQERLRTKFAPA